MKDFNNFQTWPSFHILDLIYFADSSPRSGGLAKIITPATALRFWKWWTDLNK